MTALLTFVTDIDQAYQGFSKVLGIDQSLHLISVEADHIEYGSDFEGLMETYQINGIPGIANWFSQISQDLLTPEGVPLPFAEAIQHITGMSASQAIDWLTINISDVVAMGTEAAIMTFFRKNPKAYSICLVLGIAFGLYSNNAPLVAMNGLQYFCKLRKEGRLKQGLWNGFDRFLTVSFAVGGKVCTTTFIADKALELMGVNLSEMAEHLLTALGMGAKLGSAAVAAAAAVDIMESISNFGLSLLVGQAIGKLVNWFNDDVQKELSRVEALFRPKSRSLTLSILE